MGDSEMIDRLEALGNKWRASGSLPPNEEMELAGGVFDLLQEREQWQANIRIHEKEIKRLIGIVTKQNAVVKAAAVVIENDQHIDFGIPPPGWISTHQALHNALRVLKNAS
jgi:hypothetical protein